MKAHALLVAIALLAGACVHAAPPEPPHWVPALLTEEEAKAGFYPLFDGTTLEGWWDRGGGEEAYRAEDGKLIVTGEGVHDWLFTDNEYANFVLRYEYRLPEEGGNSGVAIRATKEGNPAFSGMEIQVLTPDWETPWQRSGSLYASVGVDEPVDNPAGEWNSVEVRVDGNRVATTMNGTELYDVDITETGVAYDEVPPLAGRAKTGHIAIQNHGDYVEFRKIRVRPLPGGPGWKPLWNGADLSGWTVIGHADWLIEDGVLTVDNSPMLEKGRDRSELRSEAEYGDFEMRLMVRAHPGANSGVFFRGKGEDPWPRSYEAQVDNDDPRQFTGAIWDQQPASELRTKDGWWFQMYILADGAHIKTKVNGRAVTDFQSERYPDYDHGWFSLQGHDPQSVVDFKDIEIRPLGDGGEVKSHASPEPLSHSRKKLEKKEQ